MAIVPFQKQLRSDNRETTVNSHDKETTVNSHDKETTADNQQPQERRFRITPRMVIAAVIAIVALVFVFQNTGNGRVELLVWSITMPTWIWLLVIFIAGVVTGSLFPWMHRRPRAEQK